jgi:hypothetical protein
VEVGWVGLKAATTAGILAVVVTACSTVLAGAAEGGFWLRSLFVACWLAAAVVVAWRGEGGVARLVTVVFLISFPVAFANLSSGGRLVDQAWQALGSVSVVAFLYLFPRGAFEPRWSAVSCAVSAGYLTARAFVPQLAGWTGDLAVFPLIVLVPLVLQVLRFRSASNPVDRRRLQMVGLTSAVALVGQLVLFGLITGLWQGPPEAAEPVVEPLSYGLALLMPAGVTLAVVPLGGPARQILERLTGSADGTAELITRMGALAQSSTSARELVPIASEAIRRSLRVPAVVIELAGSAESAGAASTDGQGQSPPRSQACRSSGTERYPATAASSSVTSPR